VCDLIPELSRNGYGVCNHPDIYEKHSRVMILGWWISYLHNRRHATCGGKSTLIRDHFGLTDFCFLLPYNKARHIKTRSA
jgi:hypothetical protein